MATMIKGRKYYNAREYNNLKRKIKIIENAYTELVNGVFDYGHKRISQLKERIKELEVKNG